MAELKRFRLKRSQHCDNDPHTGKNTVYVKGDVFDSDKDLLKENRATPDKDRFELVSSDTPMHYAGCPLTRKEQKEGKTLTTTPSTVVNPSAAEDTFSSMTLDELKKFAQAEDINLGKAKSKDEVLAVIRAATAE
jgi:hypothetical protein